MALILDMVTSECQSQAGAAGVKPLRRIAIDFDGTIADTNVVKAGWIRKNLGLDLAPWDCSRSRCVPIIGLEKYERMAEFVYGEEGTRIAGPVPGALDGLRSLARRAGLFVVTRRTGSHLVTARQWLGDHAVDQLFVDVLPSAGRTKSEVCLHHEIEVLLDDDLRHAGTAGGEAFRVVLLARGPACALESGAIFVKSWPEFVDWTALVRGRQR
jgi:hypothetical protein